MQKMQKNESDPLMELVSDLFTARCIDLNLQAVNTKLRENFMLASKRIFKGRSLNFSNLNLGPECSKIIVKILSTYQSQNSGLQSY